MELPDLIPDSEAVLAAAWFEQDGKLKAATGHKDYPWNTLEKLSVSLSRHLEMDVESFEWLVFDGIQLFMATRGGEGLLWIAPAEVDSHWVANGLILTLVNLQQQEEEAKVTREVSGPNGVTSEEATVSESFMKDFEKVLSKAMGPTVACRLILQTATHQGIDANSPRVHQLDGFIHEISLQIPYRGRRSIFLTEVNQLIRSHGISPKRLSYSGRSKIGGPSPSLSATSR